MEEEDEVEAKKIVWAEIAGWYGTFAIVLAYILVSFNIVPAGKGAYQLLNLTGAIGIVVIAAVKKTHQPLVLNLFWATIAVVALIRICVR